MPATLRAGVLEWTDLDIDYRVHLDGAVERLDVQEFGENAALMGYPLEVLEQVQAACLEVEVGVAQQAFPFDGAQQIALYRRIKLEAPSQRRSTA